MIFSVSQVRGNVNVLLTRGRGGLFVLRRFCFLLFTVRYIDAGCFWVLWVDWLIDAHVRIWLIIQQYIYHIIPGKLHYYIQQEQVSWVQYPRVTLDVGSLQVYTGIHVVCTYVRTLKARIYTHLRKYLHKQSKKSKKSKHQGRNRGRWKYGGTYDTHISPIIFRKSIVWYSIISYTPRAVFIALAPSLRWGGSTVRHRVP